MYYISTSHELRLKVTKVEKPAFIGNKNGSKMTLFCNHLLPRLTTLQAYSLTSSGLFGSLHIILFFICHAFRNSQYHVSIIFLKSIVLISTYYNTCTIYLVILLKTLYRYFIVKYDVITY